MTEDYHSMLIIESFCSQVFQLLYCQEAAATPRNFHVTLHICNGTQWLNDARHRRAFSR